MGMIWISGPDRETVAESKKTLQEMLNFYLPGCCLLIPELPAAIIDALLEDEAIGALMTKPDCVVAIDEAARSVWICGKHTAAVKSRVDEVALAQLSKDDTSKVEGEPPVKRR